MTPNMDRLIKRNVTLQDRRTSVQLESYVRQSIDAILSIESISLPLLCSELDQRRGDFKLASSIRLFALIYFRTLSTYFHDETGDRDMLHSPRQHNFNCFISSLKQFSKYARHTKLPDQQKASSVLSDLPDPARPQSSLP